jgi:heme-degrading monooxygenase HmoA
MDEQEQPVILRRWTGKVPTERAQEYAKYMADTGFEEIENTEGNLGHQIMLRDLGDGTTEITALSWWTGMDAIKALVGDDCERAHYYAVDNIYLVEKPDFVEHHVVFSGFTPPER